MEPTVARRTFLGLAAGSLAALTLGGGTARAEDVATHASGHQGAQQVTPDQALKRLVEGNQRFQRDDTTLAHHQTKAWRKGLQTAQHPFATILGCCDSRVPPEILFDQGVGDLFVIRVAGNIVDAEMIGSFEYAFEHLQTPLFLVLGHEKCGAVKAAIDLKLKGTRDFHEIEGLLSLIGPSLDDLDLSGPPDVVWEKAVEANVRQSLALLSKAAPVKAALKQGKFKLMGGIYELGTGNVRLLS